MKSLRRSIACLMMFFATLAMAQQSNKSSNSMSKGSTSPASDNTSDKVTSGEAAYTIGCNFAELLGKVVCAELPSGKHDVEVQNASDATAAIAAVQNLQQQATDVSATAAAASDSPQDDSADTSAAMAALKKLKQAADDLNAATPDAFTVAKPYEQESSSDEKVPAYTFGQRVLAWGVEGIPSTETQNTPPPESSTQGESNEDTASDDTTQADEDSNRYQNSVQQFQQTLDQLNNLMYQQALRNPAPLRPSTGPQLKKGTTSSTFADYCESAAATACK